VIDDYIRFTWVFFLATKDDTSGILKSFITRIENLVDHEVKVIRCNNGTEFKNREMNLFCEMKGSIRQFRVAKTPQQNGVAERRNKTLIKAAKTILADSKIPTLSFMRPFGCPFTILNTIDHLGKFNGKADKGSRPDWLFNIDELTRTMNYEPIVTDPKSSHNDRSKPSNDDGKKVDEDLRKESEFNADGGIISSELPFDPNMPALEDVSIFNLSNNHEDDDTMADMNNLDTTIQ
nr:hypothetical protein [Tanacetum cinerariifolium]